MVRIMKAKEKGNIRRAVIPLLKDILTDIKKENIDMKEFILAAVKSIDRRNISVKNNFPETQKVKGKVEVDFPEVQKVELENPIPTPIVNVKPETIKFPSKQKVTVDGLVRTMNDDLPLGEGQEVHKDKANPSKFLVIRLSDGKKFINLDGIGAVTGGQPSGEKIWLREEYTYTTVSGMQVPTQIEKWDSQFKLTIDYEYDANANPIVMSRTLESSDGVGT